MSERVGLRGVGQPLAGTDARPDDPVEGALAPDDGESGANEQQDALRDHAAAQDGRAHAPDAARAHQDDTASDNGEL